MGEEGRITGLEANVLVICRNLIGNLGAGGLDRRTRNSGENESENMDSRCAKLYKYRFKRA